MRDLRAFVHDPVARVCLLLIVVAAPVPFINLGALPFWADESIAVLPAHNIHADLLPTSPYDLDYMPWQLKWGLWDPATPLYRYTVAGFTALTGFSEGTARAFSVLMGLCTTIPFYALVRKLYGRRTALLAVTFLVTSSTFMLFAREARHFTFLMFLIVSTFYYLYTATEGRDDASRALWVVFLAAALLAQTLGYGILPVVGLYVLLNGPSRFLAWRFAPVYALVAAVYLAVIIPFWTTLPFFHDVSCSTRPECHPSVWYYPIALLAFVAPMTVPLEEAPELGPSLALIVFLIGLFLVLRAAWRRTLPPEKWALILLWFLLPLASLSTRELKFDRYLFIWVMPPCALFMALGVRRLLRIRPLRHAPVLAGILCVLLVALSVQLINAEAGTRGWSVRSALATLVETRLLGAPDDNWEHIRWQAKYLRERMGPGDVVVTSLDDASLQRYLGQFVYGFLNSRRTDEFFTGLLDRAERDGTRVWFVDTLPTWNFCLSGEPEPWRMDCRIKYRTFYERCLAATDDSACRRLPMQ
jgi:4-amino-4-deoxy-L-arabinose transferase-like glycosyltransferase